MRWAVGIALCLIGVNRANGLEFWSPADGGNGHFYDLIYVESEWPDWMSWDDALLDASSRTLNGNIGHLLTISNEPEYQFIVDTFGDDIYHRFTLGGRGGLYAGMTDAETEGEWRWVDDTPGVWQDPRVFENPIQTAYVRWCGYIDFPPQDAAALLALCVGGEQRDYLAFAGYGSLNGFPTDEVLQGYIIEFDNLLPGETLPSDGRVSIQDLNNVRNNLGSGVLFGPPIAGDTFPFDGIVDIGDVNRVRNYFGTSVEMAAVPEPSTLALIALGLLPISVRRKR